MGEIDDGKRTCAAAPGADGANDAEARRAPGLGGVGPAIASRLEAMKRQGDMMKDLLASDEEDDADGAPGAAGGEAEVDKILGEASRVIREFVPAKPEAVSYAGYDDDDFESSSVSTPGSSVGSPSSSVSSARPAGGQQEPQRAAAASAAPPAQTNSGVSIHQIHANAPVGDDEEDYGDEDYEDEDFEEDMGLRAGDASNRDPTAVSSIGATQSDQPLLSHAANSRSIVHDKSSRTPIAQSLQMLQSEWMKEGSMQQRIYRVAVSKLAKSILMEVFNQGIDAHDERKRREEAIAARRKREAEVNFAQVPFGVCGLLVCPGCWHCTWDSYFRIGQLLLTCCVYVVGCGFETQPRACDVRIEEKKKQKLEAKRKKEAEKALRDAEYVELAKEKAAKQRQEIKESESQIAESKQRFKKMREEKEKKIEQVKRCHSQLHAVRSCCAHACAPVVARERVLFVPMAGRAPVYVTIYVRRISGHFLKPTDNGSLTSRSRTSKTSKKSNSISGKCARRRQESDTWQRKSWKREKLIASISKTWRSRACVHS
jgi:hypothetical protein